MSAVTDERSDDTPLAEVSLSARPNGPIRVLRWMILGPVALIVTIGVTVAGLSRLGGDGRPSLFGFEMLVVTSGSMEPALSPGDLVIVDHDDDEHSTGDLVVFRRGTGMLVTHRIVGVVESVDGSIRYITRGDANDSVDIDPVEPVDVIGEVVTTVPLVGRVMFGARSLDFLLPVLIGLLLFDLGSKLWRGEPAAAADGARSSRSSDRESIPPTNGDSREVSSSNSQGE